MKQIKLIMMIAVLTVAWGCSSDNEENDKEKWTNSIYLPCDEPTWAVDWTAADTKPEWQNPDPTLYDSNMFYIVGFRNFVTICVSMASKFVFLKRNKPAPKLC